MSAPTSRRYALALTLLGGSALSVPALGASAPAVGLPVAPVNTATQAAITANGTPLVNIATPNAAGLSHNQYTSFNVDSRGLVLNNGGAAQTSWSSVLAGRVASNPNLASSGPATVILNEVVSPNRSLLAGYIEVTGSKADVIVANPYGITVDGAGFINTHQATLTTGVPVIGADGSLTGFNVTGGDIAVQGAGLDATQADYLALISRAITVEGQVNAQVLDAVAGVGSWDYSTLTFTAAKGDANTPTVAIDSSALGGMYANRIRLIATEAGVGVRLLGGVAANAGQLSITADGQIAVASQVSASTTLELTSQSAGISLTDATLLSGGDTTLSAANGALSFTGGVLSAGGALSLTGASLADAGDSSTLTNNNQRYGAAGLTLAIGGAGQIDNVAYTTGAALQATLGSLAVGPDGATLSSNTTLNLTATAGDLALAGATVYAAGDLNLDASGTVSTVASANGGVESGFGNLGVTGALNNGGVILANDGTLTVRASAITDTGSLEAAGALSLADVQGGGTEAVSIAGNLITNAALTVQAAKLGVSAGGEVEGLGGVTLTAASLDNAGSILVPAPTSGTAPSLQIATGALTNEASGVINGAGLLNVTASGPVSDAGLLVATGDLTLAGATPTQALAVTVTPTGSISTGGQFSLQGAADTLAIQATSASVYGQVLAKTAALQLAKLSVDGLLQSSDAMSVTDTGALSVTGTVASGAGLTLAGGATTNSGLISAAAPASFHFASLSNSGQLIAGSASTDSSTITVDGLLTNTSTGLLQSSGALTIVSGVQGVAGATPTEAISNAGSILAGGGDLTLTVATSGQPVEIENLGATAYLQSTNGAVNIASPVAILDNTGVVYGASANLNLAGLTNTGVVQTTSGDLALATTADFTNAGTLLSAAGITLSAPNVVNSGQLQAATGVTLTAQSLDDSGIFTGATAAGASNTLNLATLTVEAGGAMQYAGDLNLTVSKTFTDAGTLLATGALGVNGGTTANLQLQKTGVLQAGGLLTLTANSLSPRTGFQMIGGSGDLTIARTFDNAGVLSFTGDLALTAGGDVTNSGTLYTGGVLTLQGANFTNTGGQLGNGMRSGGLEADGGGVLTLTGSFNNVGLILLGTATDGSVGGQITASAFTTEASSMLQSTGALQLTSAGGLDNVGSVIAGGDLTLGVVGLQNLSTGLLQSGGTLTYSGAMSTQAGAIEADTLALTTPAALVNIGTIQGGSGASRLDIGGDLTNAGTILFGAATNAAGVAGSGVVSAQDIDNSGKIQSLGDLTVQANGRYPIGVFFAGLLTNEAGAQIVALGDLTLSDQNGNGLNVISSGLLESGGALNIAGGTYNYNQYVYLRSGAQSGGDLTITTNNLEIGSAVSGTASATPATVQAGGAFHITLNAFGALSNGDELLAFGSGASSLTIAGSPLSNSGAIYAAGDLDISASDITNTSTGGIASSGALTLTTSDGSNQGGIFNSGSLYAGGALTLTANNGGTIANGAPNVDNSAALIEVDGAGPSSFTAGTFKNYSTINVAGDLTISAPTFVNDIAVVPTAVWGGVVPPAGTDTMTYNSGAMYDGVQGVYVTASFAPSDIHGQLVFPTTSTVNQTGGAGGTILFDQNQGYASQYFDLASRQTGFSNRQTDKIITYDGPNGTPSLSDTYYTDTFSVSQHFATTPVPNAEINAGGTLTIAAHTGEMNGGIAQAQTIVLEATDANGRIDPAGLSGPTFSITSYPLLQDSFTATYDHQINYGSGGYNDPYDDAQVSYTEAAVSGVAAGLYARTVLGGTGFNVVLTGCTTCSDNAGSQVPSPPTPATASTPPSALAPSLSQVSVTAATPTSIAASAKGTAAVKGTAAATLVAYNTTPESPSALGLKITLPTSPNGFYVVSTNPDSRYLVETNPLYTSESQYDDSTGTTTTTTPVPTNPVTTAPVTTTPVTTTPVTTTPVTTTPVTTTPVTTTPVTTTSVSSDENTGSSTATENANAAASNTATQTGSTVVATTPVTPTPVTTTPVTTTPVTTTPVTTTPVTTTPVTTTPVTTASVSSDENTGSSTATENANAAASNTATQTGSTVVTTTPVTPTPVTTTPVTTTPVTTTPVTTTPVTTTPATLPTAPVDSDYLAALLGYNPDQLEQRLGDGAYEQQLISQQLVSDAGTSRIYASDTTAQQTRVLYQQAAAQAQALGLVYGQPLTDAQQADLTSDIVWPVSTLVQGHLVLTPVVYLSAATRNAFDTGAPEIAANNANLQLASLTSNGGAIVATQTLVLSTTGQVQNNGGLIQAADLGVNINGGFTNNGTINGVHSLALTTTGDLTNSARGVISSGNGSVQSTGGSVTNNGLITGGATGGISVEAANDVTNNAKITGANTVVIADNGAVNNNGGLISGTSTLGVKANGNVNNISGQIQGGDVAIQSVTGDVNDVTTSQTTTNSNGGYSTSFGAKAGIAATGTLAVNAANNINVTDANLMSGGDASLVAGNNINVTALADREKSTTDNGGSSNLFSSSSSSTTKTSSTLQSSNVDVGGDLYAQAGKDLNITASNVTAGGEADLIAGNNVNITGGQNTATTSTTTKSSNWFGSSSSTHTDNSTTDVASNVNAGKLYVGAGDPTTGVGDINIVGSNVNVAGDAELQAGHNVNIANATNSRTITDQSSQSGIGVSNALYGNVQDTKTNASTTNVASNLNTGGALAIIAGNDANIVGSNVNGGGGGGIQAGHDVNILAGQNTSDISETKISNTILGVSGSGAASGLATAGANGSASASANAGSLQAGASTNGGASASADSNNGYAAGTTSATGAGVNGNNPAGTNGVVGAQAQATGDATADAQGQANATAGLALYNNTVSHSDTNSTTAVSSNVHFGGAGGTIIAGNNLNVTGSNVAADKTLAISANNVNVTTAKNTQNSSSDSLSTTLGPQLDSQNTAEITAGVNAAGSAGGSASNGSGSGSGSASAGLNASVTGSSNNDLDLARNVQTSNSSGSVTNTASNISGGNVIIVAKNDLNFTGSNLNATGDAGLSAKNITFAAANNTTTQSDSSRTTGVGFYGDTSGQAQTSVGANAGASTGASAGASPSNAASAGANAGAGAQADAGVGVQAHNDMSSGQADTSTAQSSTINVAGNLTRVASNAITDIGTQVTTGGDINQSAKTFNSLAAANTTSSSAEDNSETIRQGLYGNAGASASAGAGAGSGQAANTSSGAGAGAEAGVGGSNSLSGDYSQAGTSQAVTSNYSAGGKINTYTTGATTLQGSNLASNGGVNLYAGSLDFQAAHNTTTAAGTQQSYTAQAHAGVDAETTLGGGLQASYNGSEGASQSSQAVVGSIASNGPINIQTKGNANLEGTQLSSASDVNLNVGGNLNYTAAHDTSQAIGGSQQAAVGATVSGKTDSADAQLGAQVGVQKSNTAEVGAIAANGNVNIYSGGAATFEGTQLASGGSTDVEAKGPVSFNAAQSTSQDLSAGFNVGASLATSNQKATNVPTTANAAPKTAAATAAPSTFTSATPSSTTRTGTTTIGANRGTTTDGTEAPLQLASLGASKGVGATLGATPAATTPGSTAANTAVTANTPSQTTGTLSGNIGVNGQYDQSNTATASSLTAGGGISVKSDSSDVNLQGTSLNAGGPVQIAAGRDVNFTTADSSAISAGGGLSGNLGGSFKTGQPTAVTTPTTKTPASTTPAATTTTAAAKTPADDSTTTPTLTGGGAGALTAAGNTTAAKPATKTTGSVDSGGASANVAGSYSSTQQGVSIIGDGVSVSAGRDLNSTGGSIASDGDTTLNAGRNLNLAAATDINVGGSIGGSLGTGGDNSNSVGNASLSAGAGQQGLSIYSGGATTLNSGGATKLVGTQIASNGATTVNAVGGVTKSSVGAGAIDLNATQADASIGVTSTSLNGAKVATNTGSAAKAAIAAQPAPPQIAPVLQVQVGKPVTVAQAGQQATVTTPDGQPAPSWVLYSPSTGSVTASPPAGYTGALSFTLNVVGTDGTTTPTTLNFAASTPTTTSPLYGANATPNTTKTVSASWTYKPKPAATPAPTPPAPTPTSKLQPVTPAPATPPT